MTAEKNTNEKKGRPMIPDENPSREEKLKQLWLDQKHTLDLFLERGAITKAQYDKSLGDLTKKMGMDNADS